MSYVVEKADGTDVEKNSYREAKPIFDKDGVRLWKRKGDYDEFLEAKEGWDGDRLPGGAEA